MSLKRSIKDLLVRLLAPYGYTLARLEAAAPPPSAPAPVEPMETALARLSSKKRNIKTVVDIGASDGRWTAMALRHFPDCKYLLVEAQPVHAPALGRFQAAHPNVQVALAAAGEKSGTINFDASDPFGGIASDHPFPANNIVVPVTTLDHEIRARKLEGPFLLKFDTHGFEIPIFNGASETLLKTDLIVIECYNFKIAEPGILFHDMVAFLATKGFRCIDLVDPTLRPLDQCLWQMDLVFERNDRPELTRPQYQ